jgi:drug/metabolite transporter (DMT)-like permease
MDSRKNRSNKLLGVLCFVAVIAIWISYSVMAELWLDDVKIIENNSLFVSFVGQLSLVLFLFPTIYKAYQYRLMETK